MPSILVTTIFGHKTRKALVEIRLPRDKPDTPKDRRNMIQLEVAEARDLALNILQAAESAVQDAFMFQFFTDAGLAESQIAQLVATFRELRIDRQNDFTA